MVASRIYQTTDLEVGLSCQLTEPAFKHAIKVLRLRPGHRLALFNGNGYDYQAIIEQADRKHAVVKIEHKTAIAAESPLFTHLGQVLAKGDKMDWLIQKSVELGVNVITPLTSRRCDVNLPAERLAKKHQHWQRVITSACEQCGRAMTPTLNPTQNIETWLPTVKTATKLVLQPQATADDFTKQKPKSAAILVGPEGGFTAHEIEQAKSHNFIALSLGPRVLRTETASAAALSVLQHLWGDYAIPAGGSI